MKIPDPKTAVDKKWKNIETIPAWDLEKVNSKKKVILERGVRTKTTEIQRQSRAQGKHCKRRLWNLCSFY